MHNEKILRLEKSLTASNFMEVTYVVPYFSSEFSRLALNNIQYNYEDINLDIDMLFV